MVYKRTSEFLRRLLLPVTVAALILIASAASAQTVTLGWNANTEPNVSGYSLQYGTQSGNPSATLDVGNVTSRQLTGLQTGSTYYFRVRAYDTAGQSSQPSNEVSYFVPGTTGSAPTMTSVSPVSGPLAGGTQITIAGTNFVSGAKVWVGARSGTTTFISSTQVRLSAPAGTAAGTTSVRLTNPDGQSVVLANSFTYTGAASVPTITSVTPASGPLPGGTLLTIVGTNFASGATVKVGGRSATATFINSTQVRATTPAGAGTGATSVQVTNPNAQSVTRANAFTYLAPASPPTVTSVTPASGPLAGGTQITIAGTNFVSGAKVWVGARSGTTTFISSTQVRVSTPTGTVAGTTGVRLTNPDGQSVVRANAFTYTAAASSSLTAAAQPVDTLLASTSATVTADAASGATPGADTGLDADGDGLPGEWEARFGLDPASSEGVNGALGDADADGLTNADEYRLGTHPRGVVRRYLASGESTDEAQTRLALANPEATAATVLLSFTASNGQTTRLPIALPGHQSRTVDVSNITTLQGQQFSVLLESDRMVGLERLVTWDRESAASLTVAAEPSTRWYFADGSTTEPFALSYVVQNPGAVAAELQIRYLLPGGVAPIVKRHVVQPASREAIRVDREDAALASTDVAAEIVSVNDVPVVVERTQYLVERGRPLPPGGNTAMGVVSPATSWWLEGVTNQQTAFYLLLADPTDVPAIAEVTYLRSDGRVLVKRYDVPANGRTSIDVAREDPALGRALLSIHVQSTTGTPILAERTVWSGSNGAWSEGTAGAAVAEPAARWLVTAGEEGGTRQVSTSLTILNTASVETEVRVTLLLEDAAETSVTLKVAPAGLLTLPVLKAFPGAVGHRHAVLVESVTGLPSLLVDRTLSWRTDAGQSASTGAPAVSLP